ncbi:MAG: XdhC family protein [SAR324 cluster bacterium]|nr:XdhC family protein [SAR324 cluster bacterium]
MNRDFTDKLLEMTARKQPFAVATVISVRGSASAKPGAKAIIDGGGRNVFGWVGGGCAETLVREEALGALEDRKTRIVTADLDDEVLGVGMPCGGLMDVYIEPVFPQPRLIIAGQNKLAQNLVLHAQLLGFAVTVHAPQAERADYPAAEQVLAAPYGEIEAMADSFVVVATQHEGDREALGRALTAEAGYIALVANRSNAQRVFDRLRKDGFPEELFARVHTPAGLDLGGRGPEEISLSIVAEMLAFGREADCRPLRESKGRGGAALPAPPAMDNGPGALLIVGHGRIAEELARLGVLLGRQVTVNSPGALPEDFPSAARLVTGDLDFSAMQVTPETSVVIATQHKGDHLSMKAALRGQARYIGLIASQKRSGLVLDYLAEEGARQDALDAVYAPAGLDLGGVTPAEIALSVMSQILALNHGASGASMRRIKSVGAVTEAAGCKGLFD